MIAIKKKQKKLRLEQYFVTFFSPNKYTHTVPELSASKTTTSLKTEPPKFTVSLYDRLFNVVEYVWCIIRFSECWLQLHKYKLNLKKTETKIMLRAVILRNIIAENNNLNFLLFKFKDTNNIELKNKIINKKAE